jgi:two-component sensor histidine kinase
MEDKGSILVVDDDESTCRTLKLIFVKNGYKVETAGTGQEAVEKAKGKFFNVALLDIKLPDIEGIELITPLKEMHPDLEIILITGHASLETAVRAMNEGASAYITKPFNMAEVLSRVESSREKQRLVLENRKLLGALQQELTERKQSEEQVQASLHEKDVMMREIHHRVKNNFQIISSMLNMQAMMTEDKRVLESLLDIRRRINTMALLHTQLYQSESFEQIDMGTTIPRLVDFLLVLYGKVEKKIAATVTAKGIILHVSQAIPCGLIINELVSNTLKHAFESMARGSIAVSMRCSGDDTITLTVKDDGVGMPKNFDIDNADTLGLHLVRNLVKEQLKGKMGFKRNKGTEIYVEFKKIEHVAKRRVE